MLSSKRPPPMQQSQPPSGTRHKHKPRQGVTTCPSKISDLQHDAIQKELDLLPELIKANYTTWKDGMWPFQLECMAAQVLQTDVLLHAATGSGKTGIAAGPHLLPSSKGKVTLVISPLLSLHDEQVSGMLQRGFLG